MSNTLEKYLKQLDTAFGGSVAGEDLIARGKTVYDAVGKYLTARNMVKAGAYNQMTVANEAMSFDTAMNASGIDALKDLVIGCGIPASQAKECCASILNIMDRCSKGPTVAWQLQQAKADRSSNNQAAATPLSAIYSTDVAGILNSSATASAEAFGTNIDMAVPDMKVAITVAIMDFHVRLIPRVMPTRSTTQPQVSYTKEWLEVYDLHEGMKPGMRLVDLYADPTYARNDLKRIEINMANDGASAVANDDGTLKFGQKIGLIELSTVPNKYGYSHVNRTDMVADNVQVEYITVTIVNGGTTEYFNCEVPISKNRLTRMVNASDSSMRNADIKFRTYLRKGAAMSNGTVSALLANLGDSEAIVLDFNIKPTIRLKDGQVDCLGNVAISARHDVDNANLSAAATAFVTGATVTLFGYRLDARFSEENHRKTNIAVMTHRVPMSWDIPIGRNYVFDYAMGQVNAEENATNLTKIIGLGQDKVALDVAVRTLEDVYDRIQTAGGNPVDQPEYVGAAYVAGDKVRPSVFQGTLDLTQLNVIRDADRSGDIKQKAISMLTAATSKILQESFLQQQLGGSVAATFKGITSIEILGNVIGMPHIHNHLDKSDDKRNLGDGVEYVLTLPNGVKIEFVTSTFNDVRDKIILWPTVANNAESELHFAHNWDYGCMVAHYTPSGEAAHHRLFGNIRELPIVTNPIGLIITVKGQEIANGIALDGVLRPTVNTNVEGSVNTTVTGTVETAAAGN